MSLNVTKSSTFPKTYRIVLQRDFDRVFKQGRVANDDTLVINAIRNTVGHPRLGLSISKLVGNAPTRNRWKRLIREAFRHHKATWNASIDLVVRPKRGSQPDLAKIVASLKRLSKKLDKQLPADASE
jgi:ribonuclease P protein component